MVLWLSELRLVIRRSLANWRLLSTVMVGVLFTIALLSSVPFYSSAINELGLNHSLREQAIEMLDIQVYAPNYPISYDSYLDAQTKIEQQVSRNIKSVVRQQENWVKSQDYFAGWPDRPTPPGEARPEGYFQLFTNLEQHITMLDGLPAAPPRPGITAEDIEDPDFAIEGMIGGQTAKKFDVGVGDRLVFFIGYGENEKQINIKLTGIIEPRDIDEEFWFLKRDMFTADGMTAPVFIPEQTLFEVVPLYNAATRANYNFYYFIDLDRLNSGNAVLIKDALVRMQRQLLNTLPRVDTLTALDVIIKEYQSKLMFTQIPLFLIVFQVAIIILYYLVTVSGMLIERQAGEIALFRSRGASTRQIIGIYFGEGLIITAIGAAIGPFLGASVFKLLGTTSAFKPLTGGGAMPARFSETVLWLTLVAALLCLLTLLVPAIQAARRSVVHQRQQIARPLWSSLWQRYYIDVALLVIGGLLYWELKERGSLVTLDVFGGIGTDPMLLVTPMLLLMAVAIIFMRIFPLAIGLATRISKYVRNPVGVLGLWYMARNPVHYSRLILLLIMSASVGMFSAAFLGTLERSYSERVSYQAGSDVRLARLTSFNVPKAMLQQQYSRLEGIQTVSPAYRSDGTMGTLFTQTDLTMLAVDADTIGKVAWYRDDFSDKSLSQLAQVLRDDAPLPQGLELPGGTTALGLWVYPEEGNIETSVYANIRDAHGRHIDISLGSTTNQTWQYLEADLSRYWSQDPSAYPLRLDFIYIRPNTAGGSSATQGLYFDDLLVKREFRAEPGGATLTSTETIESFEDVSRWTAASDSSGSSGPGTPQVRFNTDRREAYSGNTSARMSWGLRRGSGAMGVFADRDSRPLAAIASRSFLENARVNAGDFIQVRVSGLNIPVWIADVVDYFPTVDPAQKGFLLVNLDRLTALRTLDSSLAFYPNEAWLSLNGDSRQRAETVGAIKASPTYRAYETYATDEMIENLKTDPLAGAGWSGVLMIAFVSVVLVSSLGFVLYSYLSAQQRQLDFAILRTLGFSLRQIIGLVGFEQVFIILVGMGLGTLTGQRLSNIMMPFLQLTERGDRVLPPFVLTIDWGIISIAYAILALAFIITVSLVILFFSKVAIHRTLRMGDM